MKTNIIVVMLGLASLASASTPHKGHKVKYVCHYDRKTVTWSPCNPLTHKKTMIMALKPGQPAKCEALQTLVLPCTVGKRRCTYDSGKMHQCNPTTGRQAQVRSLLAGSDADCPKVLRKEMPCKVSHKEEHHQEPGPELRARHVKAGISSCLYRVTKQLACDPEKKTRTLMMTLTKASPRSCKPEKTLTLPCRKRNQTNLLEPLPAIVQYGIVH